MNLSTKYSKFHILLIKKLRLKEIEGLAKVSKLGYIKISLCIQLCICD